MTLQSHPRRQAWTKGPFPALFCLLKRSLFLSPIPVPDLLPGCFGGHMIHSCLAFASLVGVGVFSSSCLPYTPSLSCRPLTWLNLFQMCTCSLSKGIHIWVTGGLLVSSCSSQHSRHDCSLLFNSLCPWVLKACSGVNYLYNIHTLIFFMGFILLLNHPS